MPRVKKEVVEENFEEGFEESFEESLEKLQPLEDFPLVAFPIEEKNEREGKVLFIAKSSIFISSLVNGVECGFSIPLNEQNKDVKSGDLIKF